MALPPAGSSYTDPVFGTPTVRIANARPEYSELQAWNSDRTLLLTNSTEIRDATTLQIVHTIDFGWPDWGAALRWSPVDPHVLYYLDNNDSFCSGAVLLRYRLNPGTPWTRTRELVRCFPEYTRFFTNESWEELSDDGRYIALLGRKPAANAWGYVAEAFCYDIVGNVKHAPMELPVSPTYGPRTGDHIAMSPSGNYVLMWWEGGTTFLKGVEAFDRDMRYLGKVSTASTPHSTMCIDPATGQDVVVLDNASNGYVLSSRHYIVKAKVPIGVLFDADGNVDAAATVASGATVPLVELDWYHGTHVSGHNRQNPGWVVVSSTETQEGYDNGWQPFEAEVFRVFLDSTPAAPHVDRIAHHRSADSAIAGRDACSGRSNYWAQPHATVSPDGTQVIYGSNWGRICDTSDPVDAFILTLSAPSPDVIAPAAVLDLGAR
jgi:hypothetical protein